ncbi:MAG: response regulator [Betaproteobacteria bacterium]|nr:MAG: response regulator [Betaproteobacteria bacterium]TMH22035.1 MAG: response regulator [Betaproteobacteria bacterium]TMH47852.1 MAG: response regulator [Betaproteobacteria bacterium]TMI07874.1 MAG: response regulator [Betaproteobacteria bacterium]
MSKKILIADDEPNIVAALEFLLQRSGYEVHVARNGDEALKLVEATHPDLVLLDVMMPQKSGYEVCMRIRERADWRHIKIIMLSAKGRDAEVSKGLSMGADIYVTKPFSTRELMDRIRDLLGQSTAGPA